MAPNPEPVILLVEDEEDDVFLFRKALKGAGVQNRLVLARHGQEAVDYLTAAGAFTDRKQFPLPALIFLDLKLPYRSGLEILGWLRQQPTLSSIVTVVLSSSNQARDLEAADDLGAKTYLVKPPTAEMICELMNTLKVDGIRCHTPV